MKCLPYLLDAIMAHQNLHPISHVHMVIVAYKLICKLSDTTLRVDMGNVFTLYMTH